VGDQLGAWCMEDESYHAVLGEIIDEDFALSALPRSLGANPYWRSRRPQPVTVPVRGTRDVVLQCML
jgi:hypothetical protein